jgi:hypothetical protein
MEHLEFSISIHTPADKVWHALWNDSDYREWTRVFDENSHAISDWKEGSTVRFMSGSGSGMQSTIVKMIPGKYMSFRHEGELKNGELLPVTEAAKAWIGAVENYTLLQSGETTDLLVEVDVNEKEVDWFEKNFPKALDILKTVAERESQGV